MSTTMVPLIDLKANYLSIRNDIKEAINRVLDSGNYVMGPEVETFEKEWAEYCGAAYCVGVSSCTDALYLTLRAMKDLRMIKEKNVWTTPLTFYATTQAIVRAGLYPEYIDVDIQTGNVTHMDFGDDAAIMVHLYGRPGVWEGKNLIEDAAQMHGKKLMGLAACHSFYPTKNLGAMGQAGAVVTNDKDLYLHIKSLRTYGEQARFVCHSTTGNHRMDELQAAILRAKLPYLDGWNKKRRKIGLRYTTNLAYSKRIILPLDHLEHNYHIYAIRCRNRDSLAAFLKVEGIQTSSRYLLPMHLQPAVKDIGPWGFGMYPNAEEWASEVLTLPCYPEMTFDQVDYACNKITEWEQQAR